MLIYRYKLKFQGSTHFGDTGIDLENVSECINSDTLFSALVNAVSTLEGGKAATDFVNRFINQPPILISSLFLYTGDIFFLPRPMIDNHIPKELKRTMGKELKGLKWLTVEEFKKWTCESALTEPDICSMQDDQEKYKKAFEVEMRPRVSLDRTTQQSKIYHAGYVYFHQNAGLYGLAAFNDLSTLDYFKRLLSGLGDIGLGGEKTYGCGMFKVVEFQEVTGIFKDILEGNSRQITLLSLYHPSTAEEASLDDKLIAYDVIRKKGWINSGRHALPLKRKSIGFITEGSVFKEYVKGRVADVTPETDPYSMLTHNVYRYGYAFTVPLGGSYE
ncbi:MAG: type III-A CRISPR-associated RAMP protein Csm4 [Nitrospirae bacterium]|nr:type III-A CRISPR-associated RAMP protein Csm4 [Nitrospirota bacterium]